MEAESRWVRPVTAFRRSLALTIFLVAFPFWASANGVSNCYLSKGPAHSMTLGTCAGESAAGRSDLVVTPGSGTVGAWTFRVLALSGRTLATTRCEMAGATTCKVTVGRGWARSFGSSLTRGSQHVTFDSKVPVRFVLTIGPAKRGTPFSGSLTFTAAGAPRA